MRYTDPSGYKQYEGAGTDGRFQAPIRNKSITELTLGELRQQFPNFYFENHTELFYEAQQYQSLWYNGSKAFDRLDEASLSHSSYLVAKLYLLRKDGQDLSKLTVGQLDQMSFELSSTFFKIDSIALGIYGTSYGVKGSGNALVKDTGSISKNTANLRTWAEKNGWVRQDTAGGVEQWGVKNADGTFSWRLKLKPEASTREGLGAGSNQPRFDARLDDKGTYINPFTGETGGRSVGTHIPLGE